MDFLSDDVVAENKGRILNVMDEFIRKCLMADAKKVYKVKQLITALENLVTTYGKPEYIRCDSSPELVSKKMAKFCKKYGIEIQFTQPGKLMQNGLVERLNGTVRTECLNPRLFTTPQQIWLNQEKLYVKIARLRGTRHKNSLNSFISRLIITKINPPYKPSALYKTHKFLLEKSVLH